MVSTKMDGTRWHQSSPWVGMGVRLGGYAKEGALPEREPDACEAGAGQPLCRGLHERQRIQESIVAGLRGHALAAGPAQRERLSPLNLFNTSC